MVVKNILKYLRMTKDVFSVYRGESELIVRGYRDISFQTEQDNYKSQLVFVFCLNGGAITNLNIVLINIGHTGHNG